MVLLIDGGSYSMVLMLAKIFVSCFIVYIAWYKEAFGNVPIILYGTVLLATLFISLDLVLSKKVLPTNGFINMLLIYGVFSLTTGIFVSTDKNLFFSMMITYFAFVLVCWQSVYISNKLKTSNWLLNIFIVISILCAIQTIFAGQPYQTEVIVTTMSEMNNPHTLGLVMLVGIFSLITNEQTLIKNIYIKFLLLIVFVYVILLSGSRKSLIFSSIFLSYYGYRILNSNVKLTLKRLLSICVTFILAIPVCYYCITNYLNSVSFERLLMLFESSGAINSRWLMYVKAFELWCESPIVGIGFCQYQVCSGFEKYSHSSYAEILACTGIMGFVIFFVPIVLLGIKLLKKILGRSVCNKKEYIVCMVMLTVELLMGGTQIFIYDILHLLVLLYLYSRYAELDILYERNIGKVI